MIRGAQAAGDTLLHTHTPTHTYTRARAHTHTHTHRRTDTDRGWSERISPGNWSTNNSRAIARALARAKICSRFSFFLGAILSNFCSCAQKNLKNRRQKRGGENCKSCGPWHGQGYVERGAKRSSRRRRRRRGRCTHEFIFWGFRV